MNNLLLLCSVGAAVGAGSWFVIDRVASYIEALNKANWDLYKDAEISKMNISTQLNSVLDKVDYLKKEIMELRKISNRTKLSKPNKK